jgi:kinesin family protein 5
MNSINLSLSTLGKCIRALGEECEDQSKLFLPYRDCILTRLLKDAFSTDVKLTVLVNVSSNPENMPETLSTLGFSTNCKKVQNKVFLPFKKQK